MDKRSYHQDNIRINLYSKDKVMHLELNLVFQDGKYYIQTPEEAKVVILSQANEIQIVDDYKPNDLFKG